MATRYIVASTRTSVVGGVDKFHPTILMFSQTGLMVYSRRLVMDNENQALRQAQADCEQIEGALMAKMRVLGYTS